MYKKVYETEYSVYLISMTGALGVLSRNVLCKRLVIAVSIQLVTIEVKLSDQSVKVINSLQIIAVELMHKIHEFTDRLSSQE